MKSLESNGNTKMLPESTLPGRTSQAFERANERSLKTLIHTVLYKARCRSVFSSPSSYPDTVLFLTWTWIRITGFG